MKKLKVLSVLLCLALLLALSGCSLVRRGLFLGGMDAGVTVEVELECEFPVYEVQTTCYGDGRAVSSQAVTRADGGSLSGQLLSFFLCGEELPGDLKLELHFTLLGKGETYRPPPALIDAKMDGSYYVVIAGEPGGLYTLNDGFP